MAAANKAYTDVPRPQNDKYLFAKMSTVFSFSISGFTKDDLKATPRPEEKKDSKDGKGGAKEKKENKKSAAAPTKRDHIDQMVEKKVKEIVEATKASHSKWTDPDFGPTESDPYGKLSLYGPDPPAPAGTNKYPSPESMRWDRPQYADTEFAAEEADEEEEEEDEFANDFAGVGAEEDSTWCTEGALFIDGSSSGDVIQGKLGDCWFLGALAVMGTKEELLKECFWRLDAFKEFGLFVCVFYKDCSLVYVVIDDRIPVFASNGNVVFGKCKDPNELWVPLIEKAYAKLHGCYKALIGGYVHFGLADMTGYSPRLVGLKEGYMGYSDAMSNEEIWNTLERYSSWGCLMGCSIQAADKGTHKVEADVGNGLKMGHAYSLLDVGTITTTTGEKVRLVKCRNPWGFGEWTGEWGDTSTIRTDNDEAIGKVFNKTETEIVDIRGNDGTFFMNFSDWVQRFTSLFVAVNFPDDWSGSMVIGSWTGDTGGPRGMSTWVGNPKLKLKLLPDPAAPDVKARQIFLGLYINDPRLILGKEYYKDDLYKTAMGFDIVTETDVAARVSIKEPPKDPYKITGSAHLGTTVGTESTRQPPYMYGSTQVETMLAVDEDYFIVPSLMKRKQPGMYYLHAYSSAPFSLEGGVSTMTEKETKPVSVGARETSMTMIQFTEKKEEFREKLLAEAKRLNLGEKDIKAMFFEGDILRTALKRKMMDSGFNLADFPDEDFALLDEDNSGTIAVKEFLDFFGSGLNFSDPTVLPPPPTEVPDDLIFQPVDLEGVLSVKVCMAKSVKMPKTWFGVLAESDNASTDDKADVEPGTQGKAPSVSALSRSVIRYDPKAAAAAMSRPLLLPKPRSAQTSGAATPQIVGTVSGSRHKDKEFGMPQQSASPQRPRTAGKQGNGSLLGSINEDAMSVHSVSMSAPNGKVMRDSVDKFGLAAGKKLHKGSELQQAEGLRCSFLSLLRAKSSESATGGADDAASNSILLKKKKTPSRVLISDAKSAMVRQFLAIPDTHELGLGAPMRAPMATGEQAGSTATGSVIERSGADGKLTLTTSASLESLKGERLLAETPVAKLQKGLLSDTLDQEEALDATTDFWDLLIDRVDVISNCRSDKAKELTQALNFSFRNRRAIKIEDLDKFDRPPSNAPTPAKSIGHPASSRRTGTAAVPRSRRGASRPGSSSAIPRSLSSATLAASQKTKVILTAQEITDRTLAHESQGPAYIEVYRRLINVPVIKFEAFQAMTTRGTSNATDGFVTGEGLRHWFDFFDKNNDGEITLDEFKQTLQEVNLKFSDEDVRSLFKLMDSAKKDNLADFEEFMNFFSGYIPHGDTGVVGRNTEIQLELVDFVKRLSRLIEIRCKNISECEKFFEESKVPKKPPKVSAISVADQAQQEEGTVGNELDDWISYGLVSVFPTLDQIEGSSNRSKFRRMGLKSVSDDAVARFSRIFRESSLSMSRFFRYRTTSINLAIEELTNCILESFSRRAGGGKQITEAPKETILKLWSSIAMNADGRVGFDALAEALSKAVLDLLQVENSVAAWKMPPARTSNDETVFKTSSAIDPLQEKTAETKSATGSPSTDKSTKKSTKDPILTFRGSGNNKDIPSSTGHNINDAEFMGYNLDALCRIVADKLIYSSWNRLGEDKPKASKKTQAIAVKLREHLSFNGFECFIKGKRLREIERKLKYLVHLQSTQGIGSVSYNVHVYLPVKADIPNNGAILVAYDPLTSAIFKMNIDTDTSMLPRGDDLQSAVLKRYAHLNMQSYLERFPHDAYAALNSVRLYNHVESPVENKAISDMCSRLRLVDTGPRVKLFLSEEPKLIEEIKLMLECSDLPFFSVANELSLTFEISRDFMQKAGTVRKAIYGSIRKNRRLTNFLLNINPNILVVLGVYDSDQMEVMEWGEMLAHLSDYRNPFVTVQLLPKYEEPSGVQYHEGSDGHILASEPKQDFLFEEEYDDDRRGHSDDPKNPTLQKSLADIDGGSFPEWNSKFVIKFKPPKSTSCKVLFTDVMKILIDESVNYVVIMVREATDKSIFLTAYDPRSASEYKLSGGPAAWRFSGINDVTKKFPFEKLYPGKIGEDRISVFSEELEECISKSEKMVGWNPPRDMQDKDLTIIKLEEVVTPRLLVSIYNQKGKSEELLGSCQVSISAVLSGTGTDKIQWTQLLHEYVNEDGKTGTTPAGSIMLKLGYERVESIEEEDQTKSDPKPNPVVISGSDSKRGEPEDLKLCHEVDTEMEPVLVKPRQELLLSSDAPLLEKSEGTNGVPVIPTVVEVTDASISPSEPLRNKTEVVLQNHLEDDVLEPAVVPPVVADSNRHDSILDRTQAAPVLMPRPPEDSKSNDLSSASVGQLNISIPVASSGGKYATAHPNTSSHINSSEASVSPEAHSRTLNATVVSYDTMKLPSNWDRRVDPKSGKMYYVNHETKSTQWYHPHDPRGRRSRRQGGRK